MTIMNRISILGFIREFKVDKKGREVILIEVTEKIENITAVQGFYKDKPVLRIIFKEFDDENLNEVPL